jgi:hypothetical protein
MPKKQKKPSNKKPLKKSKIKSVVNVKINIDNSKKPTMRRASTKAPQQQPFVNFPTFQPTRVQQLEPKQQFNNADLTKTMDEYQKQFKTYLETKDQDVKDLIEKFDDSLKKSIAPPKKERSRPGAYDAYADEEGQTVFESDKPKKDTWTNRNELKRNTMVETEVEPLSANQLFEEAMPVTNKQIIRGLGPEEKDEVESELKNVRKEDSLEKNYQDYVNVYKRFHGDEDENYIKINEPNPDGKIRGSQAWSKIRNNIIKKIEQYGTREQELEAIELQKMLDVQSKRQGNKNKKQEAKLKSKN